MWYRRNWRATVVSSLLQPLLFLVAFGVGFGRLIDTTGRGAQATGGVPYLMYLAPALLAVGAVQTAAFESSYPILSSFRWRRTYEGIAATPVTPGQLAGGQLTWIALRLTLSGAAYLLVITLFGAVHGPGALASLVFAVLCGMAFSAPLVAFAAAQEREGGAFSAVFRFVVLPMTLFSGTFFPISRLPGAIQPLAWISPLWHGTELARGAALGTLGLWSAAGHVALSGGLTHGGRPAVELAIPGEVKPMSSLQQLAHDLGVSPSRLLVGLLPPGLYAGRARMLIVRSALASRSAWLAIFSGFFEPLFFLAAMGRGLGSLVGAVPGPDGHPLSYAAFIAPGLLAASAMNGAVYDATFSFFLKLKYAKLYDAMLATPLGPVDIALGEIGWALIRGGMYSASFLAIMLAAGLIFSPWALLALPVALFVAFAFAAIGIAATTFMRSWQDFDLVQLAVVPMFLFSATFFPLSVYPSTLQTLVQAFPLYHAVALMRGLTTGVVGWPMLGHLAYFVMMAAVGVAVSSRRLNTLLLR